MIIARYITKEIIYTLLSITIVLLLALLCQQGVRYLNYAAVGKIPTAVLLKLVSFEIPYILAFLFPLGLYLALLLTYSRLYAESEMVILQQYGYHHRQITLLSYSLALIVSGIVLCLMIWINPIISAKRHQIMTSDEATSHLVETLIPGRFQVSPDGRNVMYVEKLSNDHTRAENVFLAQEKKRTKAGVEQRSWDLLLANEGYEMREGDSHEQFFVTTDGNRYEGTPGENDYKVIQFKKYAVRISQNDPHFVNQDIESLSLAELWQDYAIPKHAAELQWRISMGLSPLFLAGLALPFSMIRPRRSRYLALLPAILVYVIYVNLLYVARHWVAQEALSITIGMWWVQAVMLLFVFLVLFLSTQPWVKQS
jgi:lipopolysaccharide export system permease protein